MRHAPVVLALLLGLAIAAPASAQEDPSVAIGRDLYQRYCASCHGVEGRGGGPVAEHMKTPPNDLTQLGARFGTPIDEDQLLAAIDGRKDVPGHGIKTMPVWGSRLDDYVPDMPGQETAKRTTIELLVRYLVAIQVPVAD